MRPFGGRLIDGEPGLLRPAEMVCHCLLIETGDSLVLVDTGFGTTAAADPARWLGRGFIGGVRPVIDPAQTAVRQIERRGLDPRDVRHIVLTHLDFDHAGGLADFPGATVHVHATELREAQRPRAPLARARYRAAQFAHQPRWAAYADPGEPWLGFEAIRQLGGLPPEILLVPLAGHTRGHSGVAVDTGDGWLLHAGDAYFHHGEVETRPHCPPALALFEASLQADKPAACATSGGCATSPAITAARSRSSPRTAPSNTAATASP